MAYNKDFDYMAAMRVAADNGDFATAAAYEKLRNEKISGEGLGYGQTNDFSNYKGKETYSPLGTTAGGSGIDYSVLLNKLMSNGGSAADVGSALQSRVNKALNTPGLSQYAYDDVYKTAQKYISENKKQGQYDALLDSIVNRKPFEYDPAADPRFQAAATQANNRGKLAMQDTLGSMASMTGGMPSSAAVAAAQQMQNDYYSQLSAQVPGFYNQAYSEYQGGLSNDLAAYSALQGDKQYNDNRTDKASDKSYDMAIAMIKTGQMPNTAMLSEAGIDEEYAKNMAAYYLMMGQDKGGSAGGGRSHGGGGTSGSGITATESLFEAMKNSGNPMLYLSQNYKKYGVAYSTINEVYGEYANWMEESGSKPKKSPSGAISIPAGVANADRNYRALQDELNILAQGGSTKKSPLTDKIEAALKAGKITQAHATMLLRQFGLV